MTQGVEDAVKAAGFTVKRLEGDNRYKTNIEILEEAGVEGGEILVATGKDFADSLSASATGKPILLVREKMYDEQINYLKGLKGAKFYILGGQNAIDDAIVEKIAPYGTIVERLAGSGRRATAVAVAERFFEEPTMAVAAFSDKHADGLCGGPLAATLKAPIFLAKANKTSEAAEYLAKKVIETGYVLGGETVMPNETVVSVFGLKDVSEVVLPTAK